MLCRAEPARIYAHLFDQDAGLLKWQAVSIGHYTWRCVDYQVVPHTLRNST